MNIVSAACALFLAGSLMVPSLASSQDYPMIEVMVDRAKVMRVSRPAAMVIIGNPAIADATIKDSQTLIITGKQFGSTNLIVLDAEGEPIADELLSVSSALDNHVVVYRGAKRQTMSCAPKCEPVFRIGDSAEVTSGLAKQIQLHGKMANSQELSIEE